MFRMTGADRAPCSIASAQAASTADNPSERTALRICTICRSPSSLPRSLRRTRSRAAGSTQSLKGAPFLKAPGFLASTGIAAPFVFDGPIDRNAFETYIDKVPVPELVKGDTVVMDNLSSHKGPRVREMIEAAGATLLYLPPYSPDFNPIEMAFSKLKALLRKAAERTIPPLWDAIGRLIDLVTPNEAANFFKAAGYEPD